MKINNIIHFIWLGALQMPDWFQTNMLAWRKLHPEFTILTWGDKAAESIMESRPQLKPLYDSLSSFAAKSDILRLALLEEYGGIYVDGDMEPRKNIAELLTDDITCFVGWEQDGQRINNAIIGATAGHPSITMALANLPGHAAKIIGTDASSDAAHLTGPYYLNAAWWHDARVHKFPRRFFYPYDWWQPYEANLAHEDAYAIHRWEATWIGETQRPQKRVAGEGVAVIGVTGVPILNDAARFQWFIGSLDHQSIVPDNIDIVSIDASMFRRNPMHAVAQAIKSAKESGLERLILTPSDHALDRHCVEMHLNLDDAQIGVGFHRNMSVHRFYAYPGRRDVFPFAVLEANSTLCGPRAPMSQTQNGDASDINELISLPVDLAYQVIESMSTDRCGDYFSTARKIVSAMIKAGASMIPVTTAHSTKLCRHLVDAPIGLKLLSSPDYQVPGCSTFGGYGYAGH